MRVIVVHIRTNYRTTCQPLLRMVRWGYSV